MTVEIGGSAVARVRAQQKVTLGFDGSESLQFGDELGVVQAPHDGIQHPSGRWWCDGNLDAGCVQIEGLQFGVTLFENAVLGIYST